MHRKHRRPKPFILFALIPWATLCLLTGSALAAETAPREAPPAVESSVSAAPASPTPTPQPQGAASFVPYREGLMLRGSEPKILIYHTHTNEAYFPTEQMSYRQSGAWRTGDQTRSVVAVGERLKEVLERDYGFCVLHDVTDHEPPKLSSAYERSEQTMRAYAAQYPSIEVFIDLHRDACGSEPTAPKDFVTVNGEELARIMFVVGRGEQYADKPFYDTNRRFAERVTAYLQEIDPKLARQIREKPGRYNQNLSPYCLLIEVGHNGNTLEQALASVPYLAEGIAYAAAETEHRVGSWLPQGE